MTSRFDTSLEPSWSERQAVEALSAYFIARADETDAAKRKAAGKLAP